jgi:hypothetical protein
VRQEDCRTRASVGEGSLAHGALSILVRSGRTDLHTRLDYED